MDDDWVREPDEHMASVRRHPSSRGGGEGSDDGVTELHAAQLRQAMLSVADLAALPPPVPLVDGVLWRNTLAMLWGPPAAYKSFIALDWGLCVATGTEWFGHGVAQGPVLYLAAEGTSGLRGRTAAWMEAQGIDDVGRDSFAFIPQAVNLLDKAWAAALVEVAEQYRPALLIADTLARSLVGGEENSSRDMGLAIDAANKVQAATGTTVLFVHHATKEGSTERGSGALFGACETSIHCLRAGAVTTVKCRKQKDAEEFAPMRFGLETVGESCVLVDAATVGSDDFRPTYYMEKVSRELESVAVAMSINQICSVVGGTKEYVRSAINALVTEGHVLRSPGKGSTLLHTSLRPFRQEDDKGPFDDGAQWAPGGEDDF
ncbi:MAG: helicase RepA family protein [Actinobacteria bacterium]|nr:helicase RepA family protein [Actinomycetota bacterium]